MTYISSAGMDPEEMRSWQFAEENPGYQREIQTFAPTEEDMLDPDWQENFEAYAEQTDGENAIIRASNQRTLEATLRAEADMLREQLREHGIEPIEYDGR